MDSDRFLELLADTKGDKALLAHAQIELLHGDDSEDERAALRAGLEAAAVPHWFNARMLAAVLDEKWKPRAAELAGKLRGLPFVEAFSARGEDAANVHEATRLALRARLAVENPARLRELSRRALAALPDAGKEKAPPHLRIEALFHRLTGGEKNAAAETCKSLYFSFYHAGAFEAQQALAAMLAEIAEARVVGGVARAEALLRLAIARLHHQPVQKTEDEMREALTLSETAADEYRISACLDSLARLLAACGRPGEALPLQRRALVLDEARLAKAPSDVALLRNVAISHSVIGDLLLVQHDDAGALASYREAETIRRRGVEESGGAARWKRALSVSLERIGDVLRRGRDFPKALESYREGATIAQELAAAQPGNAQFQRDLSVSHNKIGDILVEQGDLPAALSAYEKARDIRAKLAESHPENAQLQRDLTISHERLGLIRARLEHWAQAVEEYRRELAIARKWLVREETSVEWYNTFALAAGNLWEILRDAPAGAVEIDRAAALADLREARALLQARKDAGTLLPPGDENLPWIEAILREVGE